MAAPLSIAFFGASLVSSHWNGAAPYYRGMIRALHQRGHNVTFYEPDAFERRSHRDMGDQDWATVVVYPATEEGVMRSLEGARGADLVIKASGVGVFDELLEREVLSLQGRSTQVIFWDVDAPTTLARIRENREDPFRQLIPRYDLILTYGGGDPIVRAYGSFGARSCIPIYNGLDPDTHYPVRPDSRFRVDLAFQGNYVPDREKRVEDFFLRVAAELPDKRFLLAGNGWDDKQLAGNVSFLGHLGTCDHNAFNCSAKAVLNISRNSMTDNDVSPAIRVFEAAGAGACIITDQWEGIEYFFEPEKEIYVATSGDEVTRILEQLTPEKSCLMGKRARTRAVAEHTYAHRARQLEGIFGG